MKAWMRKSRTCEGGKHVTVLKSLTEMTVGKEMPGKRTETEEYMRGESAVCFLVRTCWFWSVCRTLKGGYAPHENVGSDTSGDRKHQDSHKQTGNSIRLVLIGPSGKRGERIKEKGMEQEIMGNFTFLQKSNRIKEFTKESWKEEKEQGKLYHWKWTENPKQKEWPINSFGNYGQIKEGKGK